ncbi:MAG: hypothetical protein JWQ27_908 [Ferruginibacter sp.]|nr:hypothetical protein [Ferruginibacter sp.]
MKKFGLALGFFLLACTIQAQTKPVALYDLLKKLIQDSTEYTTTGDWAVGKPGMYPVRWQKDRLEMSDDIKINFFRKGNATILLNSKAPAAEWNVILMGPRMGFTSFVLTSEPSLNFAPKQALDSLLGNKNYTITILKNCATKTDMGFNYYRMMLPKKVSAWVKLSWAAKEGKYIVRLECYDDWSRQNVDLSCSR